MLKCFPGGVTPQTNKKHLEPQISQITHILDYCNIFNVTYYILQIVEFARKKEEERVN